ncbi:MAG: carboxypeptidase-like regulatory domain-containing protein [Bacteroidales bacterium]|nr:carboxypeptidase-like regulatory domain-containing protein [Bacteroidales bacterium]
MKTTKTIFIIIALGLLSGIKVHAQTFERFCGIVVDSTKLTALPYANIIVANRNAGTISNETGYFSLDISHFNQNDSIRIQYVGYQTKTMALADLDSFMYINLKADIINLSETFVFSDPPEAKSIVKKIIEHKDENYPTESYSAQTFVRSRQQNDILDFGIEMRHNSIPSLNERLLKIFEQYIPKHTTSFTDFYGLIYRSSEAKDSLKFKPIRVVSLDNEDITELAELEKVFENLMIQTSEDEYWKLKTGIISQTLDNEAPEDTCKEETNSYSGKYFSSSLQNKLTYSTLNNKKSWEFLYKTGDYNYTLAGGTSVAGEPVYIIDFTPKKDGVFEGRMYVSINSYAIIRADYKYADDKKGFHFDLFGIAYEASLFKGSIYFEKKKDQYQLKYFSRQIGENVVFDRPISFIKKRKRFMFDKTLMEIKVDFKIKQHTESLVEWLVLDRKEESTSFIQSFANPKRVPVIFVNQFDDSVWKDYPSIAPTQRMREYKK